MSAAGKSDANFESSTQFSPPAFLKLDLSRLELLNAYNVSSITDTGPRSLTVNFSKPLETLSSHSLSAGTHVAMVRSNSADLKFEGNLQMIHVRFGDKDDLRREELKAQDLRVVTPSYTAKEKAERYDAWSRIYKVLNTRCSDALDSGSLVSNTWKEEIISATPKGYIEKMNVFGEMASKSLKEITEIYREYEYLTDIRNYFENSWGAFQGILWEAASIFRDTLKRLPENPTHNLVSLVEPQAREYRKGVKAFGQWITEAKQHVAARIKELSTN